jgi:hypothetical protein
VCVCVCVCVCVYVRKSSAVFMLLFVLIMQFHSGFVRQIELVRTEHKRTELLRVDSLRLQIRTTIYIRQMNVCE